MRVSWVIVIVLRVTVNWLGYMNMNWLGHVNWLRVDMNGLRVSVDRFRVYVHRVNGWICFRVLMNRFWVHIMMMNYFMHNNWLWVRVHGFMVNVMCLHFVMMGAIKVMDHELVGYLHVVTVQEVVCMVVLATYIMLMTHKDRDMHNNWVRGFGQTIDFEQVLKVPMSVQEGD